jgi:hypothetical protein
MSYIHWTRLTPDIIQACMRLNLDESGRLVMDYERAEAMSPDPGQSLREPAPVREPVPTYGVRPRTSFYSPALLCNNTVSSRINQ